MTLPLMKHS